MERPSYWRGKNNNQNHHKYGHSNGSYPAVDSHCSINGMHDVLPAQRGHQGQRKRSDMTCQSPRAVGGGNQINGCISTSCIIEFGSVGNLAEEVISSSTMGASMDAQGGRY